MTNGDRQAAKASVRAEDGAAALEFAIVFVLLMMLLFGIIRFGQFFGQYEAMVGAASLSWRGSRSRGCARSSETGRVRRSRRETRTICAARCARSGG